MDNTNVGTTNVIINSVDSSNYAVSGSAAFEITKPSLTTTEVTFTGGPFPYDGTKKELNFSKSGSFALEAFQSSVENGIIAGYGDGRINSKGLATCA